jgi:hypothetical protein
VPKIHCEKLPGREDAMRFPQVLQILGVKSSDAGSFRSQLQPEIHWVIDPLLEDALLRPHFGQQIFSDVITTFQPEH